MKLHGKIQIIVLWLFPLRNRKNIIKAINEATKGVELYRLHGDEKGLRTLLESEMLAKDPKGCLSVLDVDGPTSN